MTIITESASGLFLTVPAQVLDFSKDVASSWAAQHVKDNSNYKWVLARYVEADNANSNGQYWTYEDLKIARPSIDYSPMNVDHHQKQIVGSWVASEMMHPTDASSAVLNPYIETLGVLWKHYFPDIAQQVQDAYELGKLFVSMECVAQTVTCGGDQGCGQTFDYTGPMSDTYCEHILDRSAYRQLNSPNFLAGALIMPGNKPGWKQADVTDVSMKDEDLDKIVRDIAVSAPGLSATEHETLMWEIMMNMITSKIN